MVTTKKRTYTLSQIDEVPPRVRRLLEELEQDGYRVGWERKQNISIICERKGYSRLYVGGWNKVDNHWYFRKIAQGHEAMLQRRYGFRPLRNGDCWVLDGAENSNTLHSAMKDLV